LVFLLENIFMISASQLSSDQLDKMPGHWVLAKMGKRVLRPGGRKLTEKMLDSLNIQSDDRVVEFAPGLGFTAQLTLQHHPAFYTAIERDETAAEKVREYLIGDRQKCVVASADNTGLATSSATVVYGEAMLSMQSPQQKQKIVSEAARLLQTGGRYGIHELCIEIDHLEVGKREEIRRAIAQDIHHGTWPLTATEWQDLLASQGLTIQTHTTVPMQLLEPQRVIEDEGLPGAILFAWNLINNPIARQRVLSMRQIFHKYQAYLKGIMLVGVKS
jgi:SAM-dependent methyltransferase